MKRTARGGVVWQREVKERTRAAKLDPRGFGIDSSLYTKKHTHVYTNRMRVGRQSYAGCSNEWVVQHQVNALRWPLSCTAPLSSNGQIHQLQLHKPQWNILFLWKQMWVILHKSLQSVKYSCSCDVSLSNGHVNSCITAVIGMMWWQKHKIHFPYIILNLSSCSVEHFFSANRLLILSSKFRDVK